jgi:hypothetical protein
VPAPSSEEKDGNGPGLAWSASIAPRRCGDLPEIKASPGDLRRDLRKRKPLKINKLKTVSGDPEMNHYWRGNTTEKHRKR